MPEINELKGQQCPICHKKTLTLIERDDDIPYFGKVYLFSMTCNNCKFHKADVECAEKKPAAKYEVEVSGEEDMKIRVVKSSTAIIKIPYITTIEPGVAANGYVTNVEGVINRIKEQLESVKNNEEEKEAVEQARKLLKKINRIMWGEEKARIIIEDPNGNSAIISEKAKVSKI